MVALVRPRHRAAPGGRQQLLRPLPVPRRAHRLVPRQPRREALPLLRLPGVRRPVHVRDGDRGARLQGGARVAGRPVRRRARDRGRGPGGRRPPRAPRAAVPLLDRAATYYARYLWESREAAAAREYLLGRGLDRGDAARVPRRLRAERAGTGCSRRRARPASARRSCWPPGSRSARATEPGQSTTGSAGGSCSRPPTPAAASAGSARGAMRDEPARRSTSTPPTASSTTSARSLFGVDLARASAAKAGRMILVEGYTDVLALHQAGMRNAVGIMGTSLTEEQVGELERIVQVLELCLDADSAGQEAMLRAARLAAGAQRSGAARGRPCRKAPTRPSWSSATGAEALRALVERSVPFVVFQVERILERADTAQRRGARPGARRARPGARGAAGQRPARRADAARGRGGWSCRETRLASCWRGRRRRRVRSERRHGAGR